MISTWVDGWQLMYCHYNREREDGQNLVSVLVLEREVCLVGKAGVE
jgi:hypothetical protein